MATTDLQIAQLCLPSWWMLHQPECQHLWRFTDFTTRGLFTEAVLLTVTVKGRGLMMERLFSHPPRPTPLSANQKASTCWMGLLSVGESGQCKWSDSMQAIHRQENKRQIIKKLKRKHTVWWELVWNKKTDTSLSPDWETVTSQNHLKDRNATMIQCTDYFCSSTAKIHCCFKRTLNWFCYYLAVKYCDGHFFTCFRHLTGGGKYAWHMLIY